MKGMWDRAEESNASRDGASHYSSVGNDMSLDSPAGVTSVSSPRSQLQKTLSTSSLLGTKESRAIWLLKIAVFVVVLLAVSAVAAATYVNITREERDNFADAVRPMYNCLLSHLDFLTMAAQSFSLSIFSIV